MLKVTFEIVPKEFGTLCEECGRFITHIVTIDCDGNKFRVGEECYENLTKKMNLSDYGRTVLKREISRIKKFQKENKLLKARDKKGLEKIHFYAPFSMRDGFNERGEWIERRCETEEEFAVQCDMWHESNLKRIKVSEQKIEQMFKNIKFKKGDKQ